ncbi:MAG: hypothetical protein MJ245_03470 [Clostridia bacterium]|nr:hypothetical protein [Clostridia bacterium]
MSDYEIIKMTFDEFKSLEALKSKIINNEEDFNKIQKEKNKYMKLICNDEDIFFTINSTCLKFVNKDIYSFDDNVTLNILNSIKNKFPNIEIKVFSKALFNDSSFFSDYVDDIENKEQFLMNNIDYFVRTERLLIQKVECNKEDEFENLSYEEKGNNIIFDMEDKKAKIIFTKIDDDNVYLFSILADRIIEESKEKQFDYNKYFEFAENAVFVMSKIYKNIYTYTEIDFNYDKYFNKIKYIKERILYKYTLKNK